jgi:HSP20 family protein
LPLRAAAGNCAQRSICPAVAWILQEVKTRKTCAHKHNGRGRPAYGPRQRTKRQSADMQEVRMAVSTGRQRTKQRQSLVHGPVRRLLGKRLFNTARRDISGTMWPDIDLVEQDGSYVIRADIPGIDKEQIDISVTGDVLTIKGEKSEDVSEHKGGYRHFERKYGLFSRSLALPENVDKEAIDATFTNGVLELVLKKTEAPQRETKKIEIRD